MLLTPIRVFLWALFLGTAYEVTLLRLRMREERMMRDLRERLRNHVVSTGPVPIWWERRRFPAAG